MVTFVDDYVAAEVSVELDLVFNMWNPYSVDPKHQIAVSTAARSRGHVFGMGLL